MIPDRIYTDTFKGGKFHLEMTENLSIFFFFENMELKEMNLMDEQQRNEMIIELKRLCNA